MILSLSILAVKGVEPTTTVLCALEWVGFQLKNGILNSVLKGLTQVSSGTSTILVDCLLSLYVGAVDQLLL
jgi:hypothetical protein